MKYLIDFKNTAAQPEIDSYLQQNLCEIIRVYSNFDKVYLVECPQQPAATDIVDTVELDDDLSITPLETTIIPNAEFGLLGSTPTIDLDLNDEQQWWKIYSLNNLGDQDRAVIGRYGSSSMVYLLDSGVKKDHNDFAAATVVDLFSVTGDFTDRTGHGTAIASVILGTVCGITAAEIKSVKIFDPNHSTKQSELLAAFDTVISDYLQNTDKFAVVNLSWGIEKNQYVENKIRTLINFGLYVVAAAGNSGRSIENVTPASMPEVITVGSYNQDFQPCDFSNYTTSVISLTQDSVNYGVLDGWAPGVDIKVATIDGQFGMAAGTSISAALVTAGMVYNNDQYVYGNTDGFGWRNIDKDIFIARLFQRKNVLNLPNNYDPTTNKILSLRTSPVDPGDDIYRKHYQEFTVMENSQTQVRTIFHTAYVKQVIVSDNMPGYVSISPSGIMSVKSNFSLDQDWAIDKFWVKLVYDGGDIQQVDIRIIKYKQPLLGTEITDPDDATINIRLKFDRSCRGTNFRCYDPYEDYCSDDCWYTGGGGCSIAMCKGAGYLDNCGCV
jgi:hypothetical protein